MRTTSEPLLCNDLGELETCMGVDDEPSDCSFGRSFMPSAAHGSRLARDMQLASFAQEKMMVLSGKKLVKPVESSLTVFAPVGSVEWCGLPKDVRPPMSRPPKLPRLLGLLGTRPSARSEASRRR